MITLHSSKFKLIRFPFCNTRVSLSLHKGKINLNRLKSGNFCKCTARTFSAGVSPNPASEEGSSQKKTCSEIQYYRNFLKSNSNYTASIWNDTMLSKNDKSENRLLLTTRNVLSEKEEDSVDQKLADLKSLLASERHLLLHNEILEMIYLLGSYGSYPKNEHVYEMLKIMDDECCKRISSTCYGFDEVLLLGDVWCCTNHIIKNKYLWKLLFKLCDRIHRLSFSQIVQMFYIFCCYRKFPPIQHPYNVHSTVGDVITNLSLDEIGIICLGYIRLKNRGFTFSGIQLILEKMGNEVENCSDYTLSVVSKFLQGSLYPQAGSSVNLFLTKIAENPSNFGIVSLINALSVGILTKTLNKQLTEYVLNQLKNDISTVRMKDIDRMLCFMASFNLVDKEFFTIIITEIEKRVREDEIKMFPDGFLSIVRYLIVFGIFPNELICKALSEEVYQNLKTRYSKSEKGRKELVYIDLAIEIEQPNYTGPRLSLQRRKRILNASKFTLLHKKLVATNISYRIQDLLISMYGNSDCVFWEGALPHYDMSCVVLRLDKDLKPQPIPESFKKGISGGYKKAADDGHLWLAFVMLRHMNYSEENVPNAITEGKLRHLRMLGFVPVLVNMFDWNRNRRENTSEQYLKNLIEQAVSDRQLEK